MRNPKRALITGLDLVPLARSARKAGYEVFAVDYFGDVDLQRLCVGVKSIIKQWRGKSCGYVSKDFNSERLLRLIEKVWKGWRIDFLLFSSGFEDSPEVLRRLYRFPVVGNDPEAIAKVRDKTSLYERLKALGVKCPDTSVIGSLREAVRVCRDIGYPVVLKPEATLGGTGIRKVSSEEELRSAFREVSKLNSEVVVQEYIEGTPVSVSLLSSKAEAIALTVNEQLLGIPSVGAREPFSYCGNVVPAVLSTETVETCVNFSLKVARYFGLLGSNGVDLVVSREGLPYVIEVNPRFQGSLECAEYVSGVNLVEAHIAACLEKRLPERLRRREGFCVRLILYAPRRLIAPDLSGVEGVRDVPFEGVIIEEGEPLCSIMAYGETRSLALKKAEIKRELIYRAAGVSGQSGRRV